MVLCAASTPFLTSRSHTMQQLCTRPTEMNSQINTRSNCHLPVIFLKFHILRRGREFRLGLLVHNQLVQLQATHQQCCRVHLHNVCLDQSPLEINEWIMSFEGEDSHLHGGGHLHVLALVESLLRCSCILGVGSETLPCEHFYLN
jgi:hypothetical protein